MDEHVDGINKETKKRQIRQQSQHRQQIKRYKQAKLNTQYRVCVNAKQHQFKGLRLLLLS